MSNFGDLVKRLRKERGLTLEAVAKKIGSHKGYVSGIENDKVNPPSVKIIRKFARLFAQDEKTLVRMAWVDKAPEIIREEVQEVLSLAGAGEAVGIEMAAVPLLNSAATGYPSETTPEGRLKPAVSAKVVLPRSSCVPELAAVVCDDAMRQVTAGPSFSQGDVILLSREEKLSNGTLAYVAFTARRKRQALFRQVMLDQGDHVVLQPLNRDYPLEFLSQDDVDAVYRVVGRIEAFERAPVEARV